MDGAGRPLQAVALLALLLTLDLPQALTSNRTRRQENLRCHVCEKENDFGCTNEQECEENVTYCNLVAVRTWHPASPYVTVTLMERQCVCQCGVPAQRTPGWALPHPEEHRCLKYREAAGGTSHQPQVTGPHRLREGRCP
ncbi:lymphocyte antigen 6K [Ictidomys tridecemlineatus]